VDTRPNDGPNDGPSPGSSEGSSPGSPTPSARGGASAPLLTAAGLTLVEGILTVMFGITEAFHVTSQRVVMGLTTSLFFVAYGAAMVLCAWGLRRLHTWARGPVLLAQLIWLGLAWNFREGETLPLAIALAVPAVVVLVGMLVPSSVDALEHGRGDD
jgi:hypothetical protein